MIQPFIPLVILLSGFSVFLSGCGGGGSSQSASNSDGTPSFSLSGRVYTAANTSVDRDTEVQTLFWSTSNNSVPDAQVIANPVTLGGYLSGRSGYYDAETTYSKDLVDFYRVYLEAGQQISLAVFFADAFESNAIDMALVLRPFSDISTVTDSAAITGSGLTTLEVANSGDYIIELSVVEDVSAPVLYTLGLSDYIVSNAETQLSPLADFVPGEVIIRYKESRQNSVSSGNTKRARTQEGASPTLEGLKLKAFAPRLGKLFSIPDTQLSSMMKFDTDASLMVKQSESKKKWQTIAFIEQLRQRDDIEYAAPNYIYRASFIPNDPLFDRQWSLPLINAPAAWELATGVGVTIAVIDSGVDQDHADLDDNLLVSPSSIQSEGYDFISNAEWAGDGDGMDNNPRDLSANLHGQHVAGIISAEGDNNTGVIGVAYDAKIMPLRVLGVDDIGSTLDIANAVLYAAGLENASGELPNNPADIINLSLGSSDLDLFLRDAISAAVSQGVLVVAAAGNENTSAPFYPAAYENVIGVSSVDSDKSKSSFSNFGFYIDVAAPGGRGLGDGDNSTYHERILSTVYANAYLDYQGTSMAAPHVAGVLALMIDARRKAALQDLTLSDVNLALNQGFITDDLANTSFFGAGLINAAKAVEFASGMEIPPVLNVIPSALSFIAGKSIAPLTLSNPGSGTITATLSTLDGWITITPDSVDAFGMGGYSITVDRGQIPLGQTLSGEITIEYQINAGANQTQVISVFASNSISETDTVGDLYVYLLAIQDVDAADQNNDDFISIYTSTLATKQQGQDYYQFSFSGIPEGDYYLEASTNHDSDYLFFDQGEGVGAYPLLTDPALIRINSDATSLEFDVSFPYQILEGSSAGLSAALPSYKPRRIKTTLR